MSTEETKQRRRVGVVVRAGAAKTLVVRLESRAPHPRYGKMMRATTTCHVHDEQSAAHVGDTVKIAECRPMSRTKRWRLVEIVGRHEPGAPAPLAHAVPRRHGEGDKVL
jgi:small subunit ribosomal protein S17